MNSFAKSVYTDDSENIERKIGLPISHIITFNYQWNPEWTVNGTH